MSVPGNLYTPTIRKTRGADYLIEQSLLFDGSTTYLNRTPGSAGNRKTWTYDCWVKGGDVANDVIFDAYTDANNRTAIGYGSTGTLQVAGANSGTTFQVDTVALLRDFSGWYHLAVLFDTTQATAADRIKIYINGTEMAQTILASPALNVDTHINSTNAHNMGRYGAGSNYLNKSLALPRLIDGVAVTPEGNLIETDDKGYINPIEYTGSFGTNGFVLDFSDTSNFGDDTSGNGNDYTPNNFASTDQLSDTPTDSVDDEIGNFATLNPLKIQVGGTLSEGNLKFSTAAGQTFSTLAIPASENFYMEATLTTQAGTKDYCGVQASSPAFTSTPAALYAEDGTKNVNYGGWGAYGATFTSGDVIGVHVNSGTVTFYKNNSTQGSATTGVTGLLEFIVSNQSASTVWDVNFGQKAFNYTPPSGAVGWATQNLPAPTIADGSDYFNTVLWTGNGTSQDLDFGFPVDMFWAKCRSTATFHQIHDVVRGGANVLYSNDTSAEVGGQSVTFDSVGVNFGSDGGINTSGRTYVGWGWKAGGTGSSDSTGNITVTRSTNATAGFSIVTGTGNSGSGANFGHGFTSPVHFGIFKNRDSAQTWYVYHKDLVAAEKVLHLDTTAAASVQASIFGTSSSSQFYLDGGGVNAGTDDWIAYLWAEVEGFSKFGTYTGNLSTDGPFVYTGFRPAFIMFKRTDTTGIWWMHDSKREPFNPNDSALQAENSNAETGNNSTIEVDFLSNGFKLKSANNNHNASGGTYIYVAFAENPFQGDDGYTQARAR